jgi:prepilin-type N-terminal cleavage/methylation domain-containing protein
MNAPVCARSSSDGRRGRKGFTIVELLVAMALILFIMAILSEAFVDAAQVFRDFKALGDMAGRLRSVTQLVRDDLKGFHFGDNRRISDPNFWANGPPQQGFFRIWQQSADVQEGSATTFDYEGLPSFTATGTWLHFTVNKRGNTPKDFFLGDLSNAAAGCPLLGSVSNPSPINGDPPLDSKYQYPSGTVYTSQWAEIAWFLKPNGATINDNIAGTLTSTTLYSLYRRQVLPVQNNYNLNWTPNWQGGAAPPPYSASPTTGYDDISYKVDSNGNFYFNDASDVTQPTRRFGMATQTTTAGVAGSPGTPAVYSSTLPSSLLATTDATYGGLPIAADGSYPISPNGYVASDIVASDVISFDVRVLIAGQTDFTDLFSLPSNSFTNTALNSVFFNGSSTPTSVRVYDTWSATKDALYDYSGWNLSYPASGSASGTNTTVPLRRLYSATGGSMGTGGYLPNDIQILAIQVTIRVWDFKAEQARQITVVVDM